jgi:hypothetical protein
MHPEFLILFAPNAKMVSKCREPVTHETSRYPPFIVLANHIINQLNHNPDSNIFFCHNDSVLVYIVKTLTIYSSIFHISTVGVESKMNRPRLSHLSPAVTMAKSPIRQLGPSANALRLAGFQRARTSGARFTLSLSRWSLSLVTIWRGHVGATEWFVYCICMGLLNLDSRYVNDIIRRDTQFAPEAERAESSQLMTAQGAALVSAFSPY